MSSGAFGITLLRRFIINILNSIFIHTPLGSCIYYKILLYQFNNRGGSV